MDLALTAAGILLAALVLADVVFTALHPDLDGPVARTVQRLWWWAARWLARSFGSPRVRGLIANAAPFALASVAATWLVGFALSISLAYWPHLDGGFAAQEPAELGDGYLDAVYVAGNVVSVLGFGDVVPLTTGLRLLTVATAVAGFAMVSSIVAYIIQVHAASTLRDELGMLLSDELGDDDGVDVLGCLLDRGDVEDAVGLLDRLAEQTRRTADAVYRLPLVTLLHRARRADRDFQPAVAAVAELAAAAVVATGARDDPRLGRSAAGIARSARRLLDELAERHRLELPEQGEPEDVQRCAALVQRVVGHAGARPAPSDPAVRLLAARRTVVEPLLT